MFDNLDVDGDEGVSSLSPEIGLQGMPSGRGSSGDDAEQNDTPPPSKRSKREEQPVVSAKINDYLR